MGKLKGMLPEIFMASNWQQPSLLSPSQFSQLADQTHNLAITFRKHSTDACHVASRLFENFDIVCAKEHGKILIIMCSSKRLEGFQNCLFGLISISWQLRFAGISKIAFLIASVNCSIEIFWAIYDNIFKVCQFNEYIFV